MYGRWASLMPAKDPVAYGKAWYIKNKVKQQEYSRKWYLANKNIVDARNKAWRLANPHRQAYVAQRWDAKQRGIPFLLTFSEWVGWWGIDFYKRGTGPICLQMCRYGDAGAYELGNIYKATANQNKLDQTNKQNISVHK